MTDADAVLGWIEPSRFAGGQVKLEPERAGSAVEQHVGGPLAIERNLAAAGIFASFERVLFPARGRDGGGAGATGRIRLASGHQLRNKGLQTIPAGERLIVEMPGGGGFGDPKLRNEIAVAEDVRLGLVSSEAAARDYGVVIRDDGQIDHVETARRRGT